MAKREFGVKTWELKKRTAGAQLLAHFFHFNTRPQLGRGSCNSCLKGKPKLTAIILGLLPTGVGVHVCIYIYIYTYTHYHMYICMYCTKWYPVPNLGFCFVQWKAYSTQLQNPANMNMFKFELWIHADNQLQKPFSKRVFLYSYTITMQK